MEFEKFNRKEIELKLEKVDIVELLKNISETHKKRLIEKKQRIKITGINNLLIKDKEK